MYWICKGCGRSIRQEHRPMCCYFDRWDGIENISDEDAVKMGLSIPKGERFEFPGDVRWDPDTGKPAKIDLIPQYSESGWPESLVPIGRTLHQFQRAVMAKVRQ